jgi:prevent-host-death family protein
MTVVNVHDAKTRFSSLLERAHNGEEIVLAKAGRPYARMVPLEPPPQRIPGRYRDTVPESFYEPLPNEEIAAWEE